MQYIEDWQPRNGLLARLPTATCSRLRREMRLVNLSRGMVLYRHHTDIKQVFFPRTGVISVLNVLANGDTGEVAMVGNEGIVGISLLVDSSNIPSRATVQSAGEAWAMPVHAFATAFHQCSELQLMVLRYAQALMTQMAQATLCTRRHKIEQQVCRWLLFAFDRAGKDELTVTHELIADALGVRREGITVAINRLKQSSGISCNRGRIQLQDRAAFEESSCECYGVVQREYQRLLGSSPGIPSHSWVPREEDPAQTVVGAPLTLLLERQPSEARSADAGNSASQDLPHQAPCVLVAEDEMYPALQLEDQLNKAGYRVLKAARLPAALVLAESEQIHAAILDINLSGTDVFPAAAMLRQRGIPFLFASAYDRIRLPHAFSESVMLQKPYEQDLLLREMGKLLQSDQCGIQRVEQPADRRTTA